MNLVSLIELLTNIDKYEKRGPTIIIIGITIVVMGVIFSLQSQSVVGPSYSFRYDNPEWTVNGSIIIAIGLVVTVAGGTVLFRTTRKSNKIKSGD